MADQQEIVSALLESYRDIGGINHLDDANLPSKSAIAVICDDLLQLLFPGFFSEEPVSSDELPLITRKRLAIVRERLCRELSRAMRFMHANTNDYNTEASDICSEFLQKLSNVRKILQSDVEAAYEGDPAARSKDEIVVAYPCLEAIAIQRLAHILYSSEVPLIPRMMTEWAHSRTGIDIHPGAKIGTHFFIDHGTGVVIGETCVIQSHVKLYHGVTLGARSFAKDEKGNPVKGIKRHPNVEDYVTIYPNATILGGDTTIGARSTIGANAFVMQSVPPDTLLVMGEQVQRTHDKKKRRGDSSGAANEFTI